jgi:hypothetical protein
MPVSGSPPIHARPRPPQSRLWPLRLTPTQEETP